MNETHQLLVYTDDGSLWTENLNTVQNNKCSDKQCQVGWWRGSEHRKLNICECLINRIQDNHGSAKTVNISFKSVANITSLKTTATKNGCFHREITIKINLGNACYLSFQNILFSCLLSKN